MGTAPRKTTIGKANKNDRDQDKAIRNDTRLFPFVTLLIGLLEKNQNCITLKLVN